MKRASSPTTPARAPDLESLIARNIRALVESRRQMEARMTMSQRIADVVTAFTGSMKFVWLHAALVGSWLVINLDLVPGIKPFDPFPFVMLAMIASVEAIFLSTFVLISQNRMAQIAERRADLDLQINLLSEHEVTRMIDMLDRIADRLGVSGHPDDDAVQELKKDIAPEQVLDVIDRTRREAEK